VCLTLKPTQTALLQVVNSDVKRALAVLHGASFAFVDLHPGNVIVYTDAAGAPRVKLIDCESMRAFGSLLTDVPVRPRFKSLDKALASNDSDNESFLYLLAWIVDEFCPMMREDEAHQSKFDRRKAEIRARCTTPDEFVTGYTNTSKA